MTLATSLRTIFRNVRVHGIAGSPIGGVDFMLKRKFWIKPVP